MSEENGLKRFDPAELLGRPVAEIVIGGKAYAISPLKVSQALDLERAPDRRLEDEDVIHLALKEQGLTLDEVRRMSTIERSLTAKIVMAVFFQVPAEVRGLEGMDQVEMLFSTGLGVSAASFARTPASASRPSSG